MPSQRYNPSDAKQISVDAGIFLSRTLSSVPCKDGGLTGRRGFAVQHATNEHIKMLWPSDNRPFVTAALGSAMIDGAKGNETTRQILAGWLDDLIALGVGKAESDAWAAKKATVQTSATSAVSGLAALARMGQGLPAQPVVAPTVAPVQAGPSVEEQIAKAVAKETASQAAQVAALTAQVEQLLSVLTSQAAPKPRKAKAKAEVVVAPSDATDSV